jgi:hypothetical protein
MIVSTISSVSAHTPSSTALSSTSSVRDSAKSPGSTVASKTSAPDSAVVNFSPESLNKASGLANDGNTAVSNTGSAKTTKSVTSSASSAEGSTGSASTNVSNYATMGVAAAKPTVSEMA